MLGASVFLLGSLGGLYTAFVNPFAVVILVERGLSSAIASIVISVVAAVRLIYVWLLGRRGQGSEFSRFISHELIIASMTIIAAILVSPWLSALLIVLRAIGVAGSVFYEELFQAKFFPPKFATPLFGLNQSGFLGGMTIGTGIGYVLSVGGGSWVFGLSALITALSAIGYILIREPLQRLAQRS